MTHRAYRFRFYPTPSQTKNLAQTFGCARHVYNWSLRLRMDAFFKKGQRIGYAENSRLLTEQKKILPWLCEVSSVPLQQAVNNLQTAFSRFFKKTANYPSFKSKRGRQSVTYRRNAFSWDPKTRSLKLAKQEQSLRIRWSRRFKGAPSTVIVSRDSAGRYFVSFLVDEDIRNKRRRKTRIGVDLGLRDFVVLSNTTRVCHPKFLRQKQQRLKLLQRRLAKKQKGSKNRAKARLKLAKQYARVSDARSDFLHKLSTRLINENQVICVESLEVKRMLRDRRLASAIADSGWSEFVRQLRYKADWYGRTLVKIDKYYPSSKRCSCCGWTKETLKLSERTWTCKECGAVHDRDLNAAKNILAAGLAVLACGDAVRLGSDKESSTCH